MTPADRALRARELEDYRTVVSCFHRPRRGSQVVPLDPRRVATHLDRAIYLVPRPSRLRQGLTRIAQTLAWASLVVTGVLCLAAILFVLWGVTQAFALLFHALLGVAR